MRLHFADLLAGFEIVPHQAAVVAGTDARRVGGEQRNTRNVTMMIVKSLAGPVIQVQSVDSIHAADQGFGRAAKGGQAQGRRRERVPVESFGHSRTSSIGWASCSTR